MVKRSPVVTYPYIGQRFQERDQIALVRVIKTGPGINLGSTEDAKPASSLPTCISQNNALPNSMAFCLSFIKSYNLDGSGTGTCFKEVTSGRMVLDSLKIVDFKSPNCLR